MLEFDIGNPTSPEVTFPFLLIFNLNIFSNTVAEIPVVYEFIKTNNGSSDNTFVHLFINSFISSSNCQTSPFEPLPV